MPFRFSPRASAMRIIRTSRRLTRRHVLKLTAASSALTAVGGIARPYLCRAARRPAGRPGVQLGDGAVDSGLVWARADRPSRMLVEVATTDGFKDPRGVFVDALPERD